MPVTVTIVASVKDWKALRQLNDECFVAKAKELRATHCRIYRNPDDASQALLLIKMPNADDVREIRATVFERFDALSKLRVTDDRIWEATNWEAIDQNEHNGKEVT